MTTTRKRRWTLAIVAMMVVLGVVGFFVLREARKNVPRLVVLRQEQANGQNMVVFRFDAPKRRKAYLRTMSALDVSTGMLRRPVYLASDPFQDLFVLQAPQGASDFTLRPPPEVEAGQSKELHVLPPADGQWRLRCGATSEDTGIRSLPIRVRQCWANKSLAPLRRRSFRVFLSEIIESELITNAVPIATETPTR